MFSRRKVGCKDIYEACPRCNIAVFLEVHKVGNVQAREKSHSEVPTGLEHNFYTLVYHKSSNSGGGDVPRPSTVPALYMYGRWILVIFYSFVISVDPSNFSLLYLPTMQESLKY